MMENRRGPGPGAGDEEIDRERGLSANCRCWVGPEVVEAVSAGALVRRQLNEEDPWALALVQRDLGGGGKTGMAASSDSLLARYPIGSLLLCQAESRDIHSATGHR